MTGSLAMGNSRIGSIGTHSITRALAIAAMVASAPSMACELPPGGERIAGSDGLVLSWRSDPTGLAVDRHFALIVHICSSVPVTAVSVDAHMPDHRHGMNYKPGISKLPSGGWKAEGLLFHMPGKWELIIGVGTERGVQRVTHTIVL